MSDALVPEPTPHWDEGPLAGRSGFDQAVWVSGIEFDGVHKRYRAVAALDDMSFVAPAGKLTGFVGPNGAGKTTSLRALLGVTPIDGGTITVNGLTVGPDTAAIVKQVGAIIEDPGLIPQLSGRANLRVAAATLGRGEEQVDELLEFVGLSDAARRRSAGYSKGMRQRLGLAAALIGDPDILVLDEPLDGLDPAGQVSFKEWLRTLVDDRGKTVVMSSHDLNDVEQLADHVVMIDKGKLVAEGGIDEVTSYASAANRVRVSIADVTAASDALSSAGFEVKDEDGVLLVATDDGSAVARALAGAGLYPSALVPEAPTLEAVFLELTEGRGA
jgi:ABC-2 type transport system ATP-binding protein